MRNLEALPPEKMLHYAIVKYQSPLTFQLFMLSMPC